jgi:hypothetical protein
MRPPDVRELSSSGRGVATHRPRPQSHATRRDSDMGRHVSHAAFDQLVDRDRRPSCGSDRPGHHHLGPGASGSGRHRSVAALPGTELQSCLGASGPSAQLVEDRERRMGRGRAGRRPVVASGVGEPRTSSRPKAPDCARHVIVADIHRGPPRADQRRDPDGGQVRWGAAQTRGDGWLAEPPVSAEASVGGPL